MDHTPEFAPRTPIDGPRLAALATFGARFKTFANLTDPLQVITEAANLKGRLDVFQQLDLLDVDEADEARRLVDITLNALHEQLLDWKVVEAINPKVASLMAELRDFVKAL